MRILAFSDLHCDQQAANDIVIASADADVVVGAGDFGIRGQRSLELFEILTNISVPFLLVSGNHDKRSELISYCETRDNIFLLDGSSQEIDGVTFFGLGGEIPARSDASWNETLDEHIAEQLLSKATPCHVLVTHTPPYGYCDLQNDGNHEGSNAITNAIRQQAPSLCLCGHIHHSWGSIEKLEETTVHNLGPTVCWHTVSGVTRPLHRTRTLP